MTKRNSLPPFLFLVVVLPLFWAGFADARPGGTYKGTSSENVFTADGGSPMPFGAAPTRIRFPNKKGSVSGTLFTTQSTPPATGDVAITGRVKKHIERQKGKKHILKGNWTWGDFGVVGPAGSDFGIFRIVIKKVGRKYKLKPAVRVSLRGDGPPHSFTSLVTGKK